MDKAEILLRRKARLVGERAEKARLVLGSYGYGRGNGNTFLTAIVDFLTDANHLSDADAVRWDAKQAMEVALDLYRSEVGETLERRASGPTSDSEPEVRQESDQES